MRGRRSYESCRRTCANKTKENSYTLMFRLRVFCLGDCTILRSSGSENCRSQEQLCDPPASDRTPSPPNCFFSVADWKHVLIDSDDTREKLLIEGEEKHPFIRCFCYQGH